VDLTPRFTETVAGYNYAFFPDRYQKANIKLDYILRSKNFLLPRNGQTSEQGGDSAVVTFQVAF
jgi:hypothetical protein